MSTKYISVMFAAALALAASTMPAVAVQKTADKPFSFAVLDIQRVIRDSKATRSIRPQIEKLKNGYEQDFKKQEEELRAANDELARQRAILSPEAYAERRRAFQQRATKVQRDVQEVKNRLDHVLGQAMSKVHDALREITAELAKEKSLTAIFPRSAVILVERRYDITDEVLKRLDKRLPSVVVPTPQKMRSVDGSKGK